jgi:glycerol uptake facilitator-like aquaporin
MRLTALAEFAGTAALLLIVTGSGIMGQRLAGGNEALALLGNSIATGAGLFVLISVLGPISGAHLNPLVTAYFWVRRSLKHRTAVAFIAAQFSGAWIGVLAAHLLFDLSLLQVSSKERTGVGLLFSEAASVVMLLSAITLSLRYAQHSVAMIVALTVTAGYWFTSSTFFANPAVSIARSMTDTFVGIAPADLPWFVAAQFFGFLAFALLARLIKPLSD